MSGTTAGHKGLEAYKNKEWEKAVSFLDKALQNSQSPIWLLARAHSNIQLKRYDAALHDAELAYHTAAERGSGISRKKMIEAQYRRAVIYFRLGRYADADCCCKWSMLLAEGRPALEKDGVEKNVDANGNYKVTYEEGLADIANQPGAKDGKGVAMGKVEKTGFEADWNRAYALRSQVLASLRSAPEGSAARKVSVSKIPVKPTEKKAPEPESDSKDESETEQMPEESDEVLKLKVDFYQSSQDVTVSLFVKDVKKENLDVVIDKDQVRLGPLPRHLAPHIKPGDRQSTSTLLLEENIIPEQSTWTVTPRKIELRLRKATPGLKWAKWGEEKIGTVGLKASVSEASKAAPAPETKAKPVQESMKRLSVDAPAPAYPTSSKSGPKNWDKIEGAEEDESKEDVNYFFKKLYKDATPEQQRAMMKSFTESNGTALSTDWNDVSKRKVETVPPEGVIPKKWES
ncbi:SGS domain-containing protein [Podospora aff. communis PSN243]|uniref:SGS domain-containing protein n=1 Tax=Podospora aff. communis PSN243 TaxID=3040156 RepID=A0AAV9GC39_9PEZI|nr:SGS domain-containing protein [Podospora aff. communis PSN243]